MSNIGETAKSVLDKPPIGMHVINTGDSPPIARQAFRLGTKLEDAVNDEVRKLLEQGIVKNHQVPGEHL